MLSSHDRKLEMIHPFFVKTHKSYEDKGDLSYRIIEKDEIEKYRDNNDFSEAFAFDENAPDEIGVAII